jgi:hypothetical protein
VLTEKDKAALVDALCIAIDLEEENGNVWEANEYRALISKLTGKVWVNVYSITREYGGPEEGGWWYNWYSLVEAKQVPVEKADETKSELEKEYDWINEGNIYSVLGGSLLNVIIEDAEGQSTSRVTSHYE